MKIFIITFFIFGAEFLANSTRAANSGDVVINEVAWMGTTESYNNEWIELYNNTATQLNLGGWILRATDGTPTVSLSGIIAPEGYFLLERTDDNTLLNQTADQIYAGALGNSGEHLELIDNNGVAIDDVNSWGSWFSGDNTAKQTMERKNSKLSGSDPTNWGASLSPAGTPRVQNSVRVEPQTPSQQNLILELNSTPNSTSSNPSPEITPLNSTTTASTSTAPDLPALPNENITVIYPENIFVNELMPSPLGTDELEEWIELENKNPEQVDISLWQIQDTAGAISTYIFPEGSTMPPRGFLVLSRITTKITLNNEGDSIRLMRPNNEILQIINYDKAPKGRSYARTAAKWQWTDVPTPGSANIITESSAPPITPQAPAKNSPKNTGVTLKINAKENLSDVATSPATTSERADLPLRTAAIGEAAPKTQRNLIYILAPLLALLSAVFIFFLKKQRSKVL